MCLKNQSFSHVTQTPTFFTVRPLVLNIHHQKTPFVTCKIDRQKTPTFQEPKEHVCHFIMQVTPPIKPFQSKIPKYLAFGNHTSQINDTCACTLYYLKGIKTLFALLQE